MILIQGRLDHDISNYLGPYITPRGSEEHGDTTGGLVCLHVRSLERGRAVTIVAYFYSPGDQKTLNPKLITWGKYWTRERDPCPGFWNLQVAPRRQQDFWTLRFGRGRMSLPPIVPLE